MCDIIERVESFGINREQLQQALRMRPGPVSGKWSAASISLVVLGVVEEAWSAAETTRN